MTNLTGDQRLGWFTRERLLVGLPLVGCGLAAVAVVLAFVRPTTERIGALNQQLDDLQLMQQSLPSLSRTLAKAEQDSRRAQDQQALLVDLIAGSDRIQTFLALLDQDARASGVRLLLVEPTAAPPPPKPKPSRAKRGAKAKDETPPQDPLVALGYRKTSMVLRVEGPFGALQQFLQQMELLQVLVESSDLDLEAVELPAAPSAADTSTVASTELGLRLSFYDRLPSQPASAESGDKGSASGTPPSSPGPRPEQEAPS